MTDKEYGENVGKLIQDENWEIVVYCKDCKFQYTEECHCSYDDSTEWDDDGYIEMDFNTVYLMGNNDYCSYGKKR